MTRDSSHRRAGRPKSRIKRDAILKAAGDAFLAEGFDATSMDRIAADAGVSKQTVYSHFETKEALLHAVVSHKVASYEFDETAPVWRAPVATGLEAIGRRFVDLILDPEVVAMHRVIVAECQRSPDLARTFWASGPERTIRPVAAAFERWAREGALTFDPDLSLPEAAYRAAREFLFMAGGEYKLWAMMNVRTEIDDAELDAHLARVVRQFLKLHGTTAGTGEDTAAGDPSTVP